jgi:hypothetical protein
VTGSNSFNDSCGSRAPCALGGTDGRFKKLPSSSKYFHFGLDCGCMHPIHEASQMVFASRIIRPQSAILRCLWDPLGQRLRKLLVPPVENHDISFPARTQPQPCIVGKPVITHFKAKDRISIYLLGFRRLEVIHSTTLVAAGLPVLWEAQMFGSKSCGVRANNFLLHSDVGLFRITPRAGG